jgi:hypothetical protein
VKNAVKQIVLSLLILVTTLLVGGGCGSSDPYAFGTSNGDGMVAQRPERRRRIETNMDIYERQITDDWDLWWLVDDSSKLSEWYVSPAP